VKSPTKKGYHHGDLRNALVDAAHALVQERGAGAFSLRETARAVGVSPNAAYRHFSDKSALLTAVARRAFATLGERVKRAQDRAGSAGADVETARARFEANGRAYVRFALREPEIFHLMFGRDRAERTDLKEADRPSHDPYGQLSAALDDLVDAAVIRVDRREGAELAAWSTVHGFAALCLAGALTFPSARARDAALNELLAGLVDALGVETRR